MADSATSLSEQILEVSMTEVEPEIEPDSIADDIRRDIDGVYMYSSPDTSSYSRLIWRYPLKSNDT